MQKTKEEIVRETVEFYSNNPRSVNGSECLYFGPEGERCAFSRLCKDDEASKQALAVHEDETCTNLLRFLKEENAGHDFDFYRDLQKLHDGSGYWNEISPQQTKRELSEDGRAYCLDYFGIQF